MPPFSRDSSFLHSYSASSKANHVATSAAPTWKSQGISFGMAAAEDEKAIFSFLLEHFFNDEPVMRSTRLAKDQNALAFKLLYRRLLKTMFMAKACKESTSVVAKDASGEIVGVLLGYVSRRCHQNSFHMPCMSLGRTLAAVLPLRICKAALAESLIDRLGYDPDTAMETLDSHVLYLGDVLCISRSARGLGLGAELVRRSMAVARSFACDHYFVSASSLYSQRIFDKLDFSVMERVDYDSFKDCRGRVIVDLRGQHTHVQTMSKRMMSR